MKTAAADLWAIERYIARDDPRIARVVVDRLVVAGDSLGALPRKGRPRPTRWEPAGRELVVGAYHVQYRIVNERTPDEEVQILSVPHGRQQH